MGGTAPRAQLKTGRTDASSRTKSTKRAPSPEADEAEKGNKRPKTNGSKDTTAKPVAEKSSANATTPAPKQVPTPTFIGNLDLYSMSLPFLKREYLPANATSPKYDEVYKTILIYQAKNDRTARCYLAAPSSINPEGTSCFLSPLMEDPMDEMPFDITIDAIQRHESLSFTKGELSSFAAPNAVPNGPGISAKMELNDIHCGIQSASGAFKIKRVWTKSNPDLDGEFVELFEGFVSFKVSYSGLYGRKGHGNGNSIKFAFWGVRARKDEDGKEIGLCPMIPVSVSSE